MRVLLEKGRDLTLRSYFGIPVLHSAAGNGHKAVVQLLLENGANIKARNESEARALHWAADGDHGSVVQLLLEKGPTLRQRMIEEGQCYIKQLSTATLTLRGSS